MINETLITTLNVTNSTLSFPVNDTTISLISQQIFLTPVIIYFFISLLVTFMLGAAIAKSKEGRMNFWAIFIFSKLIDAIVLFFIFIIPAIPHWSLVKFGG